MQIALLEPEIPPNTGNVARLCAATNTTLNLIEPLGFSIDDKHLKRAGLDYWEHVDVRLWPDFATFARNLGGSRIVATSARTGTPYHVFEYLPDDVLLFGPETRGLSAEILSACPCVRVPIWGKVRSLNLSTCAGIVLYRAYSGTGMPAGE